MKSWASNPVLHTMLLLVLLAGALTLRVQDYGWIKSLRYLAFDAYNLSYPREPTDRVAIVDINEASLRDDRLGQWPWPRSDVAKLIENLKTMGAQSITFDIVFAEADRTSPSLLLKKIPEDRLSDTERETFATLPDPDQVMADAITAAGNVVTGFPLATTAEATRHLPVLSKPIVMARSLDNFSGRLLKAPGVTTNIPVLENAAAGNGSFSLSPEIDGIIRQVPLFYNVEGKVYPSLALESLRVAQDARLSHKMRPLKTAELSLLSSPYLLKTGRYNIPLDETGLFYIYYSKARPEKYIPAWQVVDGSVDPALVKDKIILVGTSAEGLKDIRSTPLNLYTAGVEGHLNVIEQILQDRFLQRPHIIQGAELLFTGLVGLLLIGLALFVNTFVLAVIAATMVAGISVSSLMLFLREGLLIDPVYPSLTIFIMFVLSSLLSYIRTELDRRAVKQAFGLYISPDYMKELTRDPKQLRLGGEIRDISVMFTDIRGFTTISEQLPPADLIHLMNDFLTPMSDLVMSNRGTIDKYMGDAMMAFWNAPMPDPDHIRNACTAALAMNESLAPINAKLAEDAKAQDKTPIVLKSGIGINSGPGAVGNMGSRQRFAYSVLGDTVNLASRLESQTKAYGVEILIGENTYKAVKDFAALELDLLRVKGKTAPVRIYTLLGKTRTPEFSALEEKHNLFLAAYRKQDCETAKTLLDACASCAPATIAGYYAMMAERIALMRKTPYPSSWDGVYTAESK